MADPFQLYHIPQQTRREKLQHLDLLHLYHQSSFMATTTTTTTNATDNDFLYTHQDLRPLALSLSSRNTCPPSILKGSKFLKPAQEVLEEMCDVGFGFGFGFGLLRDSPPLENLRTSVYDLSCGGVGNRKRSWLISLLDEVYKRYKQYYQQIEAVMASFETVAGAGAGAAPFANLDLKAMSKNFRCLNNAIMEQLSQDSGVYEPHPVWRPQRGLPKRAVTLLRAWLFDHFLHPYPTDTDKQMLAKQTGLSRNQVSNWFINARVRLWKPMVEEVHTLETRQAHTISSHIQDQEGETYIPRDPRNQEPPSKHARNDFPIDNKYNDHMKRDKGHMDFYDNMSFHRANRGVSLTLGLHQNNNGITFREPFPFDTDGSSSRFVIGGLDAQNRREIIGGQFLHDFGG